jgi:hypothetical protein
LETKLRQIRLSSSGGLGPTKERRFIIVGGINDTPNGSNLLGSHKHSSIGVTCPRLPHEGPSFPTSTTTRATIVNMVTSPIEPSKMDEEVLLVNPKRTLRTLRAQPKQQLRTLLMKSMPIAQAPQKNKIKVCLNHDTYKLYLLTIHLMFFEATCYMYIR